MPEHEIGLMDTPPGSRRFKVFTLEGQFLLTTRALDAQGAIRNADHRLNGDGTDLFSKDIPTDQMRAIPA